MRKLYLSFLLTLALGLSSCGFTTIPAGSVGIVVNNLGSNRGVQDYPVKTGFVTYNPLTTEVLEWPTNVKNVVWTASKDEGHPTNEEITFTNKDNMGISVDVSLGYSLQPDKVPSFYVKFRTADMDAFSDGFLRNITRDAFNESGGHYSIDQIMGDNEAFIKEVKGKIQGQLSPYGINIDQFGIIGRPRPPLEVVNAITAKLQATQIAIQKENEVRQATADAQKSVAYAEGEAKAKIAMAQGEAEANRIKAASITPQILDWERIALQREAVGKWNGQQPSIMTNGGNMLLQLPPIKQ